jgi:hypothetical protein
VLGVLRSLSRCRGLHDGAAGAGHAGRGQRGDQGHGGIPISRSIITLMIAVGLVVPAVAVASRAATGSTRTAIERAVAPAYSGPQRCRLVDVTTKDGGNWATGASTQPTSAPADAGRSTVSISRTALGDAGTTSPRALRRSRVDGLVYPSRSVETCTCHVVKD